MQNFVFYLAALWMAPSQPEAPTKMPPQPSKVTPQAIPPSGPTLQVPAKVMPGEPQTRIQAQEGTGLPEVLGPERVFRNNQDNQAPYVGQQVLQGPPEIMGKWRVKYKVKDQEGVTTYKAKGTGAQSYAQYGDPYGFTGLLNNLRARYGLGAVSFDANAYNAAAINNGQQAARGMGHHYTGGYSQNAAGAVSGPQDALNQWMASGPHQALLLSPTLATVGYHQNGSYASLNATGYTGGYAATGYTYATQPSQYRSGTYASSGKGLFGGIFRR